MTATAIVEQVITPEQRDQEIRRAVKEAFDLYNASKVEEALRVYADCYERFPNYLCLEGIANCHMFAYRWDEAIKAYERCASEYKSAKAYSRLAFIYYSIGKIDKSIEVASKGIEISPVGQFDTSMSRFYRACAYLRQGNYAAGFADYEAREIFAPKVGIPNLKPLPLNTSVNGKKILILGEQGFGDGIQFIRYAKKLIASGAQVSYYVDATMYSLFANQIPGVKLVWAIDGKFDMGAYDYTVKLLSLPFYFGTEQFSIPAEEKYLTPDPLLVQEWAEILGEKHKPRVGICWAGGHRPDNRDAAYVDKMRSLDFSAFTPFIKEFADKFEFVNLQKGDVALKQFNESDCKHLVTNEQDRMYSFMHTAALIENLDLVITVDTAVAHLAAAIGKPVLVLSRFNACWRWLAGQEKTPWYPSMKVLLQEKMGDWTGVLKKVIKHLKNF